MKLATLLSRAQNGIYSQQITIEVHLANGLPKFTIVGLPEATVRESKDRVHGAIQNAGFVFPNKRITVNLAPADVPKEGSRFDLPIAIGILIASNQLPEHISKDHEFLGELALSGEIRKINSALPTAIACAKSKNTLILPYQNAAEASLIESVKGHTAKHLLDIYAYSQHKPLPSIQESAQSNHTSIKPKLKTPIDFGDIKGQEHTKRILLIAAAGEHNLLMVGPPGTGKSMLASRFSTVLPNMSEDQALETASIYSISNQGFSADQWKKRPFRHPHHSASAIALTGGGSNPKPGEISLAHNGVLFLDELPEFSKQALEMLREPLETKEITLSRVTKQINYPANFQLITAMNPCPCGYYGDKQKACTDTPDQISRYRSKLSGPFLDRIDIITEVPRINHEKLNETTLPEWHSEPMRKKVALARSTQIKRQQKTNKNLTESEINQYCALDKDSLNMLNTAAKSLNLSMRSYHKIQKLARTIADLENSDVIQTHHIAEAIQLNRNDW